MPHLAHVPALLLLVLSALPGEVGPHQVVSSCPPDQDTCHFTLEIAEAYTMTTAAGGGRWEALEIAEDGRVYEKPWPGRREQRIDIDLSKVPLGDGSFKRVLLYNNSLPGPPIIVYEGQQVVVHLVNRLREQATTIHFHGAKQQDTPWMDGVSGVSQCAINPGERFTYRFLASPAGTHWYHSHYGTQRSMGAAGAYIVLERDEETVRRRRGDFPLPDFWADFYMLTQDWMRESTEDLAMMIAFDTVKFPYAYKADVCYNSTKQYDGVDSGVLPFVSALINGRGRYRGQDLRYPKPTYVPYEVYQVRRGGYFRFRVIGASMMFPLRVSVDHHPLYVMATDGHHLQATPMDSVIVFNGERYDFYIEATDPLAVGNYWIRVQTLEVMQNSKRVDAGCVNAILRYARAPEIDPTTSSRPCTEGDPCHHLNCPFTSLVTSDDHIKCHPITDLSLTLPVPTLEPAEGEELLEYFLNFHFAFPGPGVTEKPTINGVQHKLAVASPMTFPEGVDPSSEHCHFVSCDTGLCRECEHRLQFPLNRTIQLNFAVTVNNEPGVINGNDHPVHIHGHAIQVLKVAYPTYHPKTKAYTNTSTDFTCLQEHCNTLVWTNESWVGGHVPGLRSQGAPLKDSMMVPVGGYLVTRFRTNNPGFWFMHCHVEFHNAEGMALVMQMGDESEMNAKPANMRTCGDFRWSEEDFLQHLKKGPQGTHAEAVEVPEECIEGDQMYKIPALVLGVATLFLAFANTYAICSNRLREKEYEYQPLAYHGDR